MASSRAANADVDAMNIAIIGGEAILRRENREISILVAREDLTITRAWYAAAERIASAHVHHAHTDAFYVLEGELTFEIGAEAETIKVSAGGFLAASPGVAHSLHNDSGRPARWLTIHTPDGGFAAFMRGVRDGVEVAWDISAVPEGGGLPASEAIVSPHLGHLTPRIRESAVLAIVAQARDSAAWTSRGHRRRPRKRAQQNGSRTN